jgi:hypothetical protein
MATLKDKNENKNMNMILYYIWRPEREEKPGDRRTSVTLRRRRWGCGDGASSTAARSSSDDDDDGEQTKARNPKAFPVVFTGDNALTLIRVSRQFCCIFCGRTGGGDDEAGCCIFYGRTGGGDDEAG